MFHDRINPIENLEIVGDRIIGTNNCNEKYEFTITGLALGFDESGLVGPDHP